MKLLEKFNEARKLGDARKLENTGNNSGNSSRDNSSTSSRGNSSNSPREGRRVRRALWILVIAIVGIVLVAGSITHAQAPSSVTILNVSYDPTRELYAEYNTAFAKYWKAKTGDDVVVKQSHGGVYVESALGAGSEFAVYLPAIEAAARSRLPLAPIATPEGHETILFVEDNPAVRHAVARLLAESGYHVLVAASGSEALDLAHGPIDLVISDLVMPGMGGRMLVNRLRASHPRARALFISGVERDTSIVPSGTAFLPKPFGADALLRAVRAVLDGTPGHPSAGPVGPPGA